MFEYDSITVSYARELTLVSMRYSQGGGDLIPPCLGLCTVPTSSSSLDVSIRDSVCWVWLSSVARLCAIRDESK